MTQAVAVRRDGDSFQAMHFWRRAAWLLAPSSPVVRVGFESGPKGFDDVWVAYDPLRAPTDHEGHPIAREHVQCKWHVTVNDFGHEDLVNPDWINATSTSLLQRARNAQLAHAPTGLGARFKLLTNWRIAQNDPLRKYILQRSKALRLKDLFDGTTDRSEAGRIRKLWREHLGIDDVELQIFARTLSLDTDSTSLTDHRENLNNVLELRGLRRVPDNESSFVYDDIAFQWLAQGRLEFDRTSFRQACQREGLLEGAGKSFHTFGLKSFEHSFDRLEERCVDVLNLLHYFDERSIRDQSEWEATLYPKLKDFLLAAGRSHPSLRLILDAHVTLAFAAGSVLNIKSGRHVEIEQRTLQRSIWSPTDLEQDDSWPTWNFDMVKVGDGTGDLAVAVGLTHDVSDAVQRHVSSKSTKIGALLVAKPTGGAGARSVACGRHAFNLAEGLALEVNRHRTADQSSLHLFIAAPNAFTFFLGQRQPGLGSCTLYEYDFEGQMGGGYQPSLKLPLVTS